MTRSDKTPINKLTSTELVRILENSGISISDNNLLEDTDLLVSKLTDDLKLRLTSQVKSKVNVPEKQTEILYQSSLLNLIVYFESMLSDIFKYQFTKNPESIGLQDKTLKFKEIQKFKSFEEATTYLIEEELEKKMKEGLQDWINYFIINRKMKFSYVEQEKGRLVEIFTRRNIFVHNGGVVNSIYINKVNEEYRKNIKTGDKLVVDREYINEAIDFIERIGILIILETWYSQERSNEDVFDTINGTGYEFMRQDKWKTALEVFGLVRNDKKFNKLRETEKLVIQLNYWKCAKNLDGFDSIKEEVLSKDYSAFSLRYQLPLLAIQESYDRFFQLLDKACPSEITISELKKWPILRAIRKDARYSEFLSKRGHLDDFKIHINTSKFKKTYTPPNINKPIKYKVSNNINMKHISNIINKRENVKEMV